MLQRTPEIDQERPTLYFWRARNFAMFEKSHSLQPDRKNEMIVNELFSLLTPPPDAGGISFYDWGGVTRRLGEPLPMDFMQFIDSYGSVDLNSHVVVFNPFSLSPYTSFFEGAFSYLAALRTIKNECPDEVPAPLYYERGGLLPWGFSSNGDIYCWVTQGISGAWKVAVVCQDGHYESFDMTMTQFLARVFSGSIHSFSIPNELVGSGKIVWRSLDADEAAS